MNHVWVIEVFHDHRWKVFGGSSKASREDARSLRKALFPCFSLTKTRITKYVPEVK